MLHVGTRTCTSWCFNKLKQLHSKYLKILNTLLMFLSLRTVWIWVLCVSILESQYERNTLCLDLVDLANIFQLHRYEFGVHLFYKPNNSALFASLITPISLLKLRKIASSSSRILRYCFKMYSIRWPWARINNEDSRKPICRNRTRRQRCSLLVIVAKLNRDLGVP